LDLREGNLPVNLEDPTN